MLRFKRTSEFLEWLRKLKDRDAKAKIEAHLDYCELKGSLLGDTKPVGDSIYEMRFHFGPGYRIYYARSGSEIYLLLIGGDSLYRSLSAEGNPSFQTISKVLASMGLRLTIQPAEA